MNNRIALFLLTLCAAVALLPAAAFAANDGSTPLGGENAVYVSAGGDDANNGSKEAPLKTIGEAYDKVADGGTIYLLSDIKIEGRLVLAQNKTVTIAGQDAGPAPVITYAKDGSTTTDLYVFEVGVETGAPVETSLTLRNVTVDAEAQDIRCIRVCSEGTLVLDEGTTVCNGRAVHRDGNTGCSDWGGGIVVDTHGKLVMESGSAITGCSAEQGGGVYLSGEMVMNGGVISGNTAVGDLYTIGGQQMTSSAQGGGVLIRACPADNYDSGDVPAKMTMNGGAISGNEAASAVNAFGGGVAMLGTPQNGEALTNELVVTGGEISGNTAINGAGISVYAADDYWQGDSSIKICGFAKIAGNNARSVGGGIGLFGSNAQKYRNVVEMSGGEISGNTAGNKGGGVYLQAAGDEFYMTDGVVAGNEAQRAGGISINAGFSGERTDAIAGLLGGSVRDNVAKSGYPTVDDASERTYLGNAIEQGGTLYLDGTRAVVEGDIRLACTLDASGNAISTNRVVTLVNASDAMNSYELTSYESESLDGRDVVVPGALSFGGATLSVTDAEPYMLHFTHNHKNVIANTRYIEQVPNGESHDKCLVLYREIELYSVTYTDGVDGEDVFADQMTGGLRYGVATPSFDGTPVREGYTFAGWEPQVTETVTGNVTYVAQWERVDAGDPGRPGLGDSEQQVPNAPDNKADDSKSQNHEGAMPQTGDSSVMAISSLSLIALVALGAAAFARRKLSVNK